MILLQEHAASGPTVEPEVFDFSTYPDDPDTSPWTPTAYKWDFLGGVLDAKGGWYPDVGGSIGVVECWLDGYARDYWTLDALVLMYDGADTLPRVNIGALNDGGTGQAFRYSVDWASTTSCIQELRVGGAVVASGSLDAATVKAWRGTSIRLRISNEKGLIRAWAPAAELAVDPAFSHAADAPTKRPALMLHGYEWEHFKSVTLSREIPGSSGGQLVRTAKVI